MRTASFIKLLVEDKRSPTSVRQDVKLASVFATAVTAIVFSCVIGVRPDIDAAVGSVRFLYKFVVTLAIAGTSGSLLYGIGQPGLPLRGKAWGLLVPVFLLAAAVVAELHAVAPTQWEVRMIGHNSRLCLTIIPSLSVVPLACFLLALRGGAPTSPTCAGGVAGLVSAGIAATFYAANCNDDSPLFVMLWYPIAIAIVAASGALLGRYFLRW
jgi:hypothetical protein